MNIEQAYINGFVKRASEYGFSEAEAVELLKSAGKLNLKKILKKPIKAVRKAVGAGLDSYIEKGLVKTEMK